MSAVSEDKFGQSFHYHWASTITGLKELVHVLQEQCEPANSGTLPLPSAKVEALYFGFLLAARTQLLR